MVLSVGFRRFSWCCMVLVALQRLGENEQTPLICFRPLLFAKAKGTNKSAIHLRANPLSHELVFVESFKSTYELYKSP